MTIVHAITLGIIQGITEFLPVSSSGHLILLPALLGWGDQGLDFDVVVHLGTLLAVIIYFRETIAGLIRGVGQRKPTETKLSLLLIASIIPAGIVGVLFGDVIEASMRTPVIVAVSLILWAIALYGAQKYEAKNTTGTSSLKKMTPKQVLIIALAQVLALFPGTSRSGITMTAGMLANANKKTAAEFSFLMSIPVIASAGGLKIISMLQSGTSTSTIFLFVGFISSAVAGYFSISFLMKIIEKWSFTPFVLYRIILGVMLLLIFM